MERFYTAIYLLLCLVKISSVNDLKMMHHTRGPAIITIHPSSGGGIKCCCCRCCTCLNLEFFKTECGLLKITELVLGFFCQSLALNYGLTYSATIGPSFQSYLTTVTWCMMTTFLLLICYVLSAKSVSLVKQSIFEAIFNVAAFLSFLSSCSYLAYAVILFLHPLYVVTPYFQVYPAMSAAYLVGTILGLIYGYDAYKSFRYYKGYR